MNLDWILSILGDDCLKGLDMDLYMTVKRSPGSRVAKWWWEKDGLELEDMRMAYR